MQVFGVDHLKEGLVPETDNVERSLHPGLRRHIEGERVVVHQHDRQEVLEFRPGRRERSVFGADLPKLRLRDLPASEAPFTDELKQMNTIWHCSSTTILVEPINATCL